MKNYKFMIIMALSLTMLSSCKKDHYDTSHVNGVDAEGEMLLPLVSTSSSIMDLLERFQIDSLISCTDDGSLYYGLSFDAQNVVDGSTLLRFNDLTYNDHYAFPNSLPFELPHVFDTVVSFDLPLSFESDYIGVFEAWMRSGRFDFVASSNIGALQRIVVRSHDIKDASGNDMMLDFPFIQENFGFDVGGLKYETEQPNQLTLTFDFYISVEWTSDPELYVDINVEGKDFVIREMMGYVNTMVFPGSVDTTFNFFPSNLSGQLEINDARVSISERNLFGLTTRLEVNTALIYGDDFVPYSLLDPLPLYVNVPTQMTMAEIFHQKFDCTIQAHGGRLLTSYYIFVNPYGVTDVVSVADTCSIDVALSVDIPFAFKVPEVQYIDTTTISLSEVEAPEMIESLTLYLDISSTLPFNLNGTFYLYDSQTGRITDTLNPDGRLIMASFDNQPVSNTVAIEITEDRLDNALHSDCLIMQYELDTESRNVRLNANQRLGLSARAKVKYDGMLNLEN